MFTVSFGVDYVKKYTFTVAGVGAWEENWGLKLSSAEVEVEVEAELGNSYFQLLTKTQEVRPILTTARPLMSL